MAIPVVKSSVLYQGLFIQELYSEINRIKYNKEKYVRLYERGKEMNNTTLEQVEKEEKKRYKKETYQAFFYIAVGVGAFWGMLEGIEYLQVKTFATADSFLTTPINWFLFKLALAVLCLLIIPYIF